jgi:DNA helicase HerA-like ATPase
MFGYFPPYPRIPDQDPILRLLKQARVRLGLILATQNPGDLDYKGLSNAGTWFIGRLQSDNDKQRVMAGLGRWQQRIAIEPRRCQPNSFRTSSRACLMHNVHDTAGPVLVHTRWAMATCAGR